ncbi:MAG TPA: Gfo/Idh/MocA family oxidoreductase [Acidimicrobiales bacterium]
MSTTPVRWGIAGTGGIARRFALGLDQRDDARLVAVASRSGERARAFAAEHGTGPRGGAGAVRAHGAYDDLAADPDVDAVYVATPHARHCADTLLYLSAGRHVLCEKPLAMNQAQAAAMAAAARSRGLFLMEAMWSRFLPAYRALRSLIGDGRVGEPLVVEADFGFVLPPDPTHRLFDPALGGGALLDLGVYPVQLASLVLGPPDVVRAAGRLGRTGVDEHVAAVLGHPGGAVAVAKAALDAPLSCTARVTGSDGWIALPAFMHCPGSLTLQDPHGREQLELPVDGEGLSYEAGEVARCLELGLTESPDMPLDESVRIAGTLDAIRAEIGLTYPPDVERADG